MTITKNQFNQAILDTFNGMEEGAEYVLNQESFQDYSDVRKEYCYSAIKKEDHRFKRVGQKLHVSWDAGKQFSEVFDFSKTHKNLSFAFAFSFAFLTFTFALAELELLQVDTCAGKVVEINGKKYTLQPI